MSNKSNIIRSLLKVIGLMAFSLLITNTVFCNDRINTGGQGAAVRGEQPTAISDVQPAAISDVRKQTTARDAASGRSNRSSFITTEAEPLLLLLFGLVLFSVATGIKLKLLGR